MQFNQLAQKFKETLAAIYQEDEAQALFLMMLNHFLNFSRADYFLKKEEEISIVNLVSFEVVLAELLTGKPIQYILGETYFYGLPFKVNPSVLIPRPETEELVEWIIEEFKSYDLRFTNDAIVNRHPIAIGSKIENILDIGTGSGCIAIALKKNLPDVKVYASDIAADSLAIAEQNAKLNNVDVEFIEEDILKPSILHFPSSISLIVSNPPYIKEDEKPAMHYNVLANEPHRALFVSNENPLIFYEAIANFALKNLSESGLLFFEINEYLGQQTVDLLKHKGFINIALKKDMQGKDRMICCSKP